MEGKKNKLADWKERLQDRHMLSIVIALLIVIAIAIALALYAYNSQRKAKMASENAYNASFYELVNCADEIETYLAKASITSTAEHAAKTLANIWHEAKLR